MPVLNRLKILEQVLALDGLPFGRGQWHLLDRNGRLYVQGGTPRRKLSLELEVYAPTADVRLAALRVLGNSGKQQPSVRGREELINWARDWRVAQGCGVETFDRAYGAMLSRLDDRWPLSPKSMQGALDGVPAGAHRRRLLGLLKQLCSAKGVEWPAALLDPLGRGRGEKRQQVLLSDEAIEAAMQLPAPPPLRRSFALAAIYGLRPWETLVAERCERYQDCLWIGKPKRSGVGISPCRSAPPFHRHWLEAFDVQQLLRIPPPDIALSRAGSRLTDQARRHGLLPYNVSFYGLRHAYARRIHSLDYRVTDVDGAKFMGHTVAVHNQTYRRFLMGEVDPLEKLMGVIG